MKNCGGKNLQTKSLFDCRDYAGQREAFPNLKSASHEGISRLFGSPEFVKTRYADYRDAANFATAFLFLVAAFCQRVVHTAIRSYVGHARGAITASERELDVEMLGQKTTAFWCLGFDSPLASKASE